jgi:hypothetical protein
MSFCGRLIQLPIHINTVLAVNDPGSPAHQRCFHSCTSSIHSPSQLPATIFIHRLSHPPHHTTLLYLVLHSVTSSSQFMTASLESLDCEF